MKKSSKSPHQHIIKIPEALYRALFILRVGDCMSISKTIKSKTSYDAIVIRDGIDYFYLVPKTTTINK